MKIHKQFQYSTSTAWFSNGSHLTGPHSICGETIHLKRKDLCILIFEDDQRNGSHLSPSVRLKILGSFLWVLQQITRNPGLKLWERLFLTVLEARGPQLSRAILPPMAVGENLFSSTLASGGSRQSLACGCVTPISASVITLPPSLLSRIPHYLFLRRTLVIRFKVTWIIQVDLFISRFLT